MSDTTLAIFILAAVIIGGALVIWAIKSVAGNRSGLGEEGAREILGYGPPLWPMGPTNGHPHRDNEDPVA